MCNSPIYALRIGDGKKPRIFPKRGDFSSIHQLEARYGKDNILPLPCGKCDACLANYARDWAVRAMLEASYYQGSSWFVTLTYKDSEIPRNKKEARRDIQLFFKRLKKVFPGARYFGCFEKGEHTHRPHFHLILFNVSPNDLLIVGKRRRGYLWKCPTLFSLWGKGLIDIGTCTFESCGYVARYVMKKRKVKDSDEFIFMSTKPGLGYRYFMDHIDTIAEYGKIYFDFGSFSEAPLPRYFDKLLERYRPEALEHLKAQRLADLDISTYSDMRSFGVMYREELGRVKENILDDKLKHLIRRL